MKPKQIMLNIDNHIVKINFAPKSIEADETVKVDDVKKMIFSVIMKNKK